MEYNADSDLTSGALFNVRDQFKAAVSAANVFNGVLDVANDRKQFSSNGTTATTDTAIITLTNNADTGAVTKTNTFVTVKGDFSWAADESVATVTCTGGAASDAKKITASSLTFGCDAATTSITLVLNLDQAEDVSVNPTTIAVDVNHVYGTGSILTNSDVAAGEWTVDGLS